MPTVNIRGGGGGGAAAGEGSSASNANLGSYGAGPRRMILAQEKRFLEDQAREQKRSRDEERRNAAENNRKERELLRAKYQERIQAERNEQRAQALRDRADARRNQEEIRRIRERAVLEQRGEYRLRLEARDAERQQFHATHSTTGRGGYGRAAAVGGIIGSLASGNLSGAAVAIGGEIGGVIGQAVAGPVGAAVGAVLGSLMRYALNPSGPIAAASSQAIDLSKSTYALGRAGGFGGGGLYGRLGAGSNAALPGNRLLGIGAADRIGSLSAYGIVPRSAVGADNLGFMLQAYGQSPAFTGMAAGTAEAVARQGVGMGAAPNTTAGVRTYLDQFGRVMENALDRSAVLGSVQGSLELLAKSGGFGVNTGGVLNLTSSLMNGGTPGGLTGTTAASYIAGLSATASNPTGNPFAYSQLLMIAASKFNSLRTAKDVQGFMGSNNVDPNVMRRILGTNGNTAAAVQLALTAGLAGNPVQMANLENIGFGMSGIPDAFKPFYVGGFAGVGLGQAQAAVDAPGATTGSRTPGFMSSVMDWADPVQALIKRGVRADIAQQIVDVATMTGKDPLELAAIAAIETGGGSFKNINPNAGWNLIKKNGRLVEGNTAFGMTQINKIDRGRFPLAFNKGATRDQLMAEATIWGEKLNQAGGDRSRAEMLYTGGDAKATQTFMALTQGSPSSLGFPGGANTLSSDSAAGALFTSNLALQDLGPAANTATQMLQNLNKAAQALNDTFNHMIRGGMSKIYP